MTYSSTLEYLIERAYDEQVKYRFLMRMIDVRTDSTKTMVNHAADFVKDIEQLQEFKAKATQALIKQGLLVPQTAMV